MCLRFINDLLIFFRRSKWSCLYLYIIFDTTRSVPRTTTGSCYPGIRDGRSWTVRFVPLVVHSGEFDSKTGNTVFSRTDYVEIFKPKLQLNHCLETTLFTNKWLLLLLFSFIFLKFFSVIKDLPFFLVLQIISDSCK